MGKQKTCFLTYCIVNKNATHTLKKNNNVYICIYIFNTIFETVLSILPENFTTNHFSFGFCLVVKKRHMNIDGVYQMVSKALQ